MTTVTVRVNSNREWRYSKDGRTFVPFRSGSDPLEIDSTPSFVAESGQAEDIQLTPTMNSQDLYEVEATWTGDSSRAPSDNPSSGYVKVKGSGG